MGRFVAALICCGLTAAAVAADQVDMNVLPVYGDAMFTDSSAPMRVSLSNHGPAVDVTVDVTGPQSEVVYQTRVEEKKTKTIVTYPLVVRTEHMGFPAGFSIQITYQMTAMRVGAKPGDLPVAKVRYVTPPLTEPVTAPLLLIAGDGPSLKYLKTGVKAGLAHAPGRSETGPAAGDSAWSSWSLQALFVYKLKPKEALDRWLGYLSFRTVFLGSGTRTLTDKTVAALRQYVIGGGQLVFGPEPNSAIDDPRWSDMLPSKPGHGSQGFGACVRLAQPFTSSEDTDAALNLAVRHAIYVPEGERASPNRYGRDGQSWNPVTAKADGDPFSARLPSFPKMITVLLAYFVAVVPLNAFLLRRLKRPELTWITAPAFAVLFAGLLFNSAKSLYVTPPSQFTTGTFVSQAGQSTALFEAHTSMFFPSANSVPFNLQNADLLYVDVGTAEKPEVETDTGSFNVPRLRTDSLSYRDAIYNQLLPYGDWFKFRVYKAADGLQRLEVRNDGPWTVDNAVLVAGVDRSLPGSLAPGGTLSMVVDSLTAGSVEGRFDSAARLAGAQGRAALVGKLHQDDLTIKVGKELASRSSVRLAAFAPNSLELR